MQRRGGTTQTCCTQEKISAQCGVMEGSKRKNQEGKWGLHGPPNPDLVRCQMEQESVSSLGHSQSQVSRAGEEWRRARGRG